jgi:F-type H+-transporting ATPase subunit b
VRTRKLIAVLAVLLLALGGWAGTAHAQEEGGGEEGTEEISEEAHHCIELLEDGGEPEDCHEAPNPILPAADELFWAIVSFTVLAIVLWKFAWPSLRTGMDARSDRIRQSIEDAERAKTEAESVLAEYQRQLADARNESARIIEEARQTADQLRRDLQQRAEADIADMRQRANDEVQAAKDRALVELRSQVTELAIGAAERVVQQSLDSDTNRRLVESFIEQVGAGNGAGN